MTSLLTSFVITLAAVTLASLGVVAGSSVAEQPGAVSGSAAAGRKIWEGQECSFCHGRNGQGGYGPDLAGTGLTLAQFTHQIRQPWGVMPRWSAQQLSDRQLADLYAFFVSLPQPRVPGVSPPDGWPDRPSRRLGANNAGGDRQITAPDTAPLGQQYSANTVGCAQCHGAEHRSSRAALGSRTYHKYEPGLDLSQHFRKQTGFRGPEALVDYEYFKACAYDHERLFPQPRMGTYTEMRLPEQVLREIFGFVSSLGYRARVVARLRPAVRQPQGRVTYTVAVLNDGTPAGLRPEDLALELVLAPGVTVVDAQGDGYHGVQRDPASGHAVAVWKIPGLGPMEERTFTLSVTGAAADRAIVTLPRQTAYWPDDLLIPGTHSRVWWARPGTRDLPHMVKDPRRPAVGDHEPVMLQGRDGPLGTTTE